MNTCFEKRDVKKITWVSEVNGVGAMLDYVCVKGKESSRVIDVNVNRGAGGGISDHFLVVGKLKLKFGRREGVRGSREEIVKVWKLMEVDYKRRYVEGLRLDWERIRDRELGEVEEEWGEFKRAVLRWAKEVCGCKVRKRGTVRRRSEWWNDEVKEIIKKKRLAFEKFIRNRDRANWENYKARCREVKRGVKVAKRRANERWGERVEEYARLNNKKFWKEVNDVRKVKEVVCGGVRNREGTVVRGALKEGEVWSNYFEGLLNDEERGRAVVEGDWDVDLREEAGLVDEFGCITELECGRGHQEVEKWKGCGGGWDFSRNVESER